MFVICLICLLKASQVFLYVFLGLVMQITFSSTIYFLSAIGELIYSNKSRATYNTREHRYNISIDLLFPQCHKLLCFHFCEGCQLGCANNYNSCSRYCCLYNSLLPLESGNGVTIELSWTTYEMDFINILFLYFISVAMLFNNDFFPCHPS